MPKIEGMPIHHIGFAVRSIEESKGSFESVGTVFVCHASDLDRNLDFAFGSMGGVLVELIAPHDPDVPCNVSRFVEKQPCTLYHVCMETDNLDAEIMRLRKEGFRQVGKRITSDIYGPMTTGVFMYSIGMGLVEIVMKC